MDKSKIYDLLYQRSLALDKRINRLLLFLYIFPLIYFLIDNALISDVKTPLISVAKIDVILIVFPIIYSILILMIFVLAQRASDIFYKLLKLDIDYTEFTEETRRLLRPIFFINEILDKKYIIGNFLDFFMQILIYTPLAIISVFFPILFFANTIYANFKYNGDYESLALWTSIMGIWIFILAILQGITGIKKELKTLNK